MEPIFGSYDQIGHTHLTMPNQIFFNELLIFMIFFSKKSSFCLRYKADLKILQSDYRMALDFPEYVIYAGINQII